MRILNVIRHPIGGIRSYLRYTYPYLPAGCSTTILTIDVPEAALIPPSLAPTPAELRLVADRQAVARLAWSTRQALRTGRFDAVHAQGATAAVAAAWSARRYRIPFIVTLHETFWEEQFSGARGMASRWLLTHSLSRADAVVVVGEDARANLAELLPAIAARAAVRVIRSGVPVSQLLDDAEQARPGLRQRLGLGPERVLMGFVGRFMPEKGFDLVIEAVRQLRHANQFPPFTVVAVNEGAYQREYQQTISDLGLDACFAFVGLQPSVAGILGELDAVIMPSRREALGLVAMEALALGCPLIAAECLGLREVIAGSPAIRVRPGDAASLRDGMAALVRDRAAARTRAAAYAPVAREAFDSGRTARDLADLLSSLVPRR
jgi:glycosyltransferase involved in cell wall biosynthesis